MSHIGTLDTTMAAPVVEKHAATTSELSGAQKAASVLLMLGSVRSAPIMQLLGDREVAQLSAEIARAGSIPTADADASIFEFAQLALNAENGATGGIEKARS